MKFQHGLLGDEGQPKEPAKIEERSTIGGEVEKNRLFETLEEETTSERSYLKLLAIVIVPILIAGGAIFYLTLPDQGDRVRPPTGMELAIRDRLLAMQRTATDIEVYYCKDFYWARSGVESRNDLPGNPLAAIKTYTARITPTGPDTWQVEASPLTNPENDKPCGP